MGLAGLLLVAIAAVAVPWNPVDGGMPDPVSPSSVFTPEQIARSEDYANTARWLGLSSYVVSIAVLCLIGFTSVGERLTRRLPGPWLVRLFLTVCGVLLVQRVILLPWTLLARQNRLEFGLTTQSVSGFVRDLATNFAVTGLVTFLALAILIGCARRWRGTWPAVAGVLLMTLTMAGSFVYPVLIEPLFNNFTSLPEGPLRQQVVDLAKSENVPLQDVLVADASRRTTSLNAYVSGFGSTRRVVLYDTLVDDVETDQVLSVVAHELAHARHKDVLVGSLLGAGGVLLGVGLLGVLFPGEEQARTRRSRRTTAQMWDPAVAPRLLALVAVAGLLVAPVQNAISRSFETRADVDALAATNDSATFEKLQRELALRSLADPTPVAWTQWWFGTHPTALERIALARQSAS